MNDDSRAMSLEVLAGYWRSVTLGPPWWFHDGPEGMRRYFGAVVESGGLANLARFNEDTRALPSIPVRHDVWRRKVARYLATLVVEGRLPREVAARDTCGPGVASTA